MNGIMSDSNRSTIMDVFKYDLIVGVRGKEISVLKNRYAKPEQGLHFDQVEDLCLELISRSLEIHDRNVFCEAFKRDMKEKLREVIRNHSA